MTVQELGSIGEFIAAVATLVTLAYLAYQIRQNTKVARAELTKDLFLVSRSALLEIAGSKSLGKFAVETVQPAGEIEAVRRYQFSNSFFRLYELYFNLSQQGLLDKSIGESYEKVIRLLSHEVNNTVGAANSLLHSALTYGAQLAPPDREDFEAALQVVIARTAELGALTPCVRCAGSRSASTSEGSSTRRSWRHAGGRSPRPACRSRSTGSSRPTGCSGCSSRTPRSARRASATRSARPWPAASSSSGARHRGPACSTSRPRTRPSTPTTSPGISSSSPVR